MKKIICACMFMTLSSLICSQQIRDPFFLPRTKNQYSSPEIKGIKLVGIITSDNKLGAIIEHNKKQTILFTGSKISQYKTRIITHKTLTLEHIESHEQIVLKLGETGGRKKCIKHT